jgi:membrane protease subunit HflK
MFRIKNLYQYVINLQNTEEFISAATYKLLTQETVCSRFDDIIARDRRVLADLLKEKLQRLVDEEKLGVSIVEVVFLAMHPPLDVADAFEDVISAQIDKLTYELKANTENSYKLSMNQALARGKELEAESYAINQTARAIGDASAFASRTLGYQIDPELTKFRLRYERLQQVLSGKTLYVMDKSLMRKEDRIYLDIKDQEGN